MRLQLATISLLVLWVAVDRELLLIAPAVRRVQLATASDLEARYVDPVAAPRLGAYLRARSPEWLILAPFLAKRLAAELRAQSHDPLFDAGFNWRVLPLSSMDIASEPLPYAAEAQASPGVGPISIRDGVATIPIRRLGPPELEAEAIAAAYAQVHPARALVFDLRQCAGGSPGTALLWASYLFPDQVHWATLQHRTFTEEYWTLPPTRLAVPPFAGPVTVLVGPQTLGVAEGLAFHLRAQGRARIAGERTPGAGHTATRRQVTEHFWLYLPEARSIDPKTGQGWQGRGVTPDP